MHGLNFPETEHFTLEEGACRFTTRKIPWKHEKQGAYGYGPDKYRMEAFSGEDHLGYLTFYAYAGFGGSRELTFGGLFIHPDHRGRRLAHHFLDVLDRVAVASGWNFDSTVPQRKPITCRILVKRGFEPVPEKRQSKLETAYVGRSEGSTVPVYFPHPAKAREFTNSTMAGHENYRLVENIEALDDAVRVVLNAPYLLVNPKP